MLQNRSWGGHNYIYNSQVRKFIESKVQNVRKFIENKGKKCVHGIQSKLSRNASSKPESCEKR